MLPDGFCVISDYFLDVSNSAYWIQNKKVFFFFLNLVRVHVRSYCGCGGAVDGKKDETQQPDGTKAIGGTWRLPKLACLLDYTSFSLGSFTSLRICYLNLLRVSE